MSWETAKLIKGKGEVTNMQIRFEAGFRLKLISPESLSLLTGETLRRFTGFLPLTDTSLFITLHFNMGDLQQAAPQSAHSNLSIH